MESGYSCNTKDNCLFSCKDSQKNVPLSPRLNKEIYVSYIYNINKSHCSLTS